MQAWFQRLVAARSGTKASCSHRPPRRQRVWQAGNWRRVVGGGGTPGAHQPPAAHHCAAPLARLHLSRSCSMPSSLQDAPAPATVLFSRMNPSFADVSALRKCRHDDRALDGHAKHDLLPAAVRDCERGTAREGREHKDPQRTLMACDQRATYTTRCCHDCNNERQTHSDRSLFAHSRDRGGSA